MLNPYKRILKVTCYTHIIPFILCTVSLHSSLLAQSYDPIFSIRNPSDDSYLDSLQRLAENETNQINRLLILNDLGYYWHTQNLTKADEIIRSAIDEAEVTGTPTILAQLKTSHAAILLRSEKLDQAEQLLREAISILSPEERPLAYTQMGYVYERRGQLDSAAHYANLNLKLGQNLKNKWAEAMALSDLAGLAWKQNRIDQAIQMGLRSIEIFESRNINDLDYDFTLYLVGTFYQAQGDIDKATSYINRSIAIGERYGFYNNLSDAYLTETEINIQKGQLNAAASSGQNALRYAQKLNNAFMQMRSYLAYGKVLNEQMKYSEAVNTLERGLAIASDKFGDKYWLAQTHREISIAQDGIGDHQAAYQSLIKSNDYQAAYLTTDANQRLAELQTLYETSQQQALIKSQEAEIIQKDTRFYFSIVLLAITLLASAILLILTNKLRKREQEKDLLMKEIHHRVKNNLQILSSLLSLQSMQENDEIVQDALQVGKSRVQAMSLIHERLYHEELSSSIEIKDYIETLCNEINQSYESNTNKISISTNISVGKVDVETAIPLGLIINELITNSIKYAFAPQEKGIIEVNLSINENGQLQLIVRDNGVGTSEPISTVKSTQFGSKLVKVLSKKLKGDITIQRENGYSTMINFNRYKLA